MRGTSRIKTPAMIETIGCKCPMLIVIQSSWLSARAAGRGG
jgi:hypothetical protein